MQVRFDDVKVGQELPGLDIPLTTSLIVSTALASRDFTPVHHDKGAAQQSGVDDVFMNILTTNGLVGRFVTDWAGPDARITRAWPTVAAVIPHAPVASWRSHSCGAMVVLPCGASQAPCRSQ